MKIFTIIFFIVISLAAFPACHGGNNSNSSIGPAVTRNITFVIHGYESFLFNPARIYRPLKDEFEKRGFKCLIVQSPRTKITPNRDQAKAVIEALKNVKGDIVLVGLSGEGLYMPLVAAERPVKRIVMLNAVIPMPGKSFREAYDFKQVFVTRFARRLADKAPEMNEVCPLKELPKVEWVYICGEKDEAIQPEWEQQAARKYLNVEPVIIKGAKHATIISRKYAGEVADAAVKGL